MRCTRALVDMPRWEQDGDTDTTDLMFVGDVKQKVTLIKCWKPRIHQLHVVRGHVQTGPRRRATHERDQRGAAGKATLELGWSQLRITMSGTAGKATLELGCSQLRLTMRIDECPKNAKCCPPARRGGS